MERRSASKVVKLDVESTLSVSADLLLARQRGTEASSATMTTCEMPRTAGLRVGENKAAMLL